jgi:hypothetical protein
MIIWYDRKGQPLSMEEAVPLLADISYKRVDHTEVGPFVVSTVWLGLDHSFGFGDGRPVIFESMTFTKAAWRGHAPMHELDADRYCTEEEAQAGHQAMVKRAKKLLPRRIRGWRKMTRNWSN